MPNGKLNRRESQSHDDWEGCSSMVSEEFIRHADSSQSATCKIGPLGVSTFVPSRALRRLLRRDIRENRHGQNHARMGRVRDSISQRGEGIGSLECRRAAPQWRRFRQGSVPGDAGGPSAFHFNEQVHRYIDYHNHSDYSNYSILQAGQE